MIEDGKETHMDVYRDDEAYEATVKGTDDAPLDLVSEEFAEFAKEEMGYEDREEDDFIVEGQEFAGVVLGFGTSFDPERDHSHDPRVPAPKGKGCNACRWADVAILRVSSDDNVPMYVVVTMGKSKNSGEDQRVSATWTPDPMGVLRALPVAGRNGAPSKIPAPNATAFRNAATVDKGIARVLEEHEEAIPDYAPRVSGLGF
jgi:hypothetical protein